MGSEVLQVDERGLEEVGAGQGGRRDEREHTEQREKRGGLGLAVQPEASHCPPWFLNPRTPDPCTPSRS